MAPSESIILLVSLAFIAPLILIYLINKHPNLVAKGQDAAGRGMAVGCTSILLMIVSVVLAIAAAIVVAARHEHMALAWRIIGLLPLGASIITALAIWITLQLAKARRIERDYQEAMSIPAALIVDDDDARPYRLYDALRPSFPTLEISTRHPGALYGNSANGSRASGLSTSAPMPCSSPTANPANSPRTCSRPCPA